ncbi:MAG: hypothetical protein ISR78_07070 [Spirochaetia bacterium]|nr:hypothetical protein [Spirochaetia bacterium]
MKSKREKKIINLSNYSQTDMDFLVGSIEYTHVDFNTDFLLWFFLESKNIDLLSRFINAVMYDMHFEPLEYITAMYSLENENPNAEDEIYSILIDAKTNKGNFRQIVILPCANPLTPACADEICAKAYLDFHDISPSPIDKRALHFIFLLNHPYLDFSDAYGLLKTDFHIVNLPKTTMLNIPFKEGGIVMHYLQFPLFFSSNLQDVDIDLIIFMSVFILISKPKDEKYYELFSKLDSGIHRIWEAYEQFMKK